MATDLDSYKLKNEIEKLKDAIIKYTPDNEGLVNTVKGLTPKNNILINSLLEEWNKREVPELSEKDIIKQNLDYQARAGRQETLAQVGLDPNDLVNEKRWVLKTQMVGMDGYQTLKPTQTFQSSMEVTWTTRRSLKRRS